MTIRLFDWATSNIRHVSLEIAAEETMLDEHEIEWAIEEFGICETDEFVMTEVSHA